MRSWSLRKRLALGALFWMVTLIVVTHLVAGAFTERHVEMRIRRVAHFSTIGVVGLGFLAVGLWMVKRGLSPFRELRDRLAAVRDGRDQRIKGNYPSEVQPVVNELNALLEDRERRVGRAVAKAGDLAHGLKTPLAVLSQEAERAQAAGQQELAATVSQQVERMRRQIDYHLAHARAAASGAAVAGARCPVADSAEGLVRTLVRLHAGRGLSIETRVSPAQSVRVQREDLDEMLGNLLDNACKWAKSRVVVESSEEEGGFVVITVDDDGPGIAAPMRDQVLQRGVRADEAAPGSGFGLAIVRDLAELYGGSISLETAPMGGLRARLRLPSR
jgi:signal transduction histidine kinase